MKIKYKKFNSNIHNCKPVYSVSISSCGTYLATGGGDSLVKIWNLKSIESKNNQFDDVEPLQIIKNHKGSVNSVKWSNKVKSKNEKYYFASGSDDKSVIIWECKSSDKFMLKIRVIFLSHSSDIQDLSWSPRDNYIASCSIDNKVIIWNVKTKKKIKTLRDHKNWVVGCDWQSTGKYLSAHSSDGTLILWNTKDWKIYCKIDIFFEKIQMVNVKDFSKFNKEIAFSRMSFSPNGQFLAVSRGFDKLFMSPIFFVENKLHSVSLFGHEASISVTKFCQLNLKTKTTALNVFILAIGSMDNSFSIWRSDQNRPIAVFNNFFKNAVLDISWSKKEMKLIVCSFDGSIALIDMTDYCKCHFDVISDISLDEIFKIKYSGFNPINNNEINHYDVDKFKRKNIEIENECPLKKKNKLKDFESISTNLIQSHLNKILKKNNNKEIYNENLYEIHIEKSKSCSIIKFNSNEKNWTKHVPYDINCFNNSKDFIILCNKNEINIYNTNGFLIYPITLLSQYILGIKIFKDILFIFLLNKILKYKIIKLKLTNKCDLSIISRIKLPKDLNLLEIQNFSFFNNEIKIKTKLNKLIYCEDIQAWKRYLLKSDYIYRDEFSIENFKSCEDYNKIENEILVSIERNNIKKLKKCIILMLYNYLLNEKLEINKNLIKELLSNLISIPNFDFNKDLLKHKKLKNQIYKTIFGLTK